jgi:DNA-binding response OmpR family regulator
VKRILVVEDEARVAAFLKKGLTGAGYTVAICDDGIAAAAQATQEDFDLVLLDVGLPGQDGFAVLRSIRSRGEHLPVIFLTARDEVSDTVAGLEGGADDYVTKPFIFEELLARVRARLREDPRRENPVMEHGPITLDLRSRKVAVEGREVVLTAREFTMLETFLSHAGQVLSREQLLSHVWGYDYDPGSNVVDVYVGYLRRKLGPGVIETVRGMGYRLAAD